MISRTYLTRGGNLTLLDADVPDATLALERDGYAIVRGGSSPDEVLMAAARLIAGQSPAATPPPQPVTRSPMLWSPSWRR